MNQLGQYEPVGAIKLSWFKPSRVVKLRNNIIFVVVKMDLHLVSSFFYIIRFLSGTLI